MDWIENNIKGMRRSGSDPLKLISFSAIKGHSVTLMSWCPHHYCMSSVYNWHPWGVFSWKWIIYRIINQNQLNKNKNLSYFFSIKICWIKINCNRWAHSLYLISTVHYKSNILYSSESNWNFSCSVNDILTYLSVDRFENGIFETSWNL